MLQSNAGTPGLNANAERGRINCRYTKGALGVQEKRKVTQRRIYVECVEKEQWLESHSKTFSTQSATR